MIHFDMDTLEPVETIFFETTSIISLSLRLPIGLRSRDPASPRGIILHGGQRIANVRITVSDGLFCRDIFLEQKMSKTATILFMKK